MGGVEKDEVVLRAEQERKRGWGTFLIFSEKLGGLGGMARQETEQGGRWKRAMPALFLELGLR